ncbi:hypothetical protein SFLOR_v1c09510 [Spiroplasma floricola 23-6]|uniref:Uncharacterized protein n=1 Tax=Spiroplasma floricola 23-6 TaxID=1336749 RepID=A0A2K8SEX1_9MOLU|nr:hypothetical protein SFLOR_v1c09510 [Spiroplasma floricola 23-6]
MGILNIISWILGLGKKAEIEERKHYKKLNKTLKEKEEKGWLKLNLRVELIKKLIVVHKNVMNNIFLQNLLKKLHFIIINYFYYL